MEKVLFVMNIGERKKKHKKGEIEIPPLSSNLKLRKITLAGIFGLSQVCFTIG
jgi:hypothetical protein